MGVYCRKEESASAKAWTGENIACIWETAMIWRGENTGHRKRCGGRRDSKGVQAPYWWTGRKAREGPLGNLVQIYSNVGPMQVELVLFTGLRIL